MYMEHMNINSFNNWAKNHILDDNRFDDEGFIIMENNRNYKSTGIIARIFEDNWDAYYSKYQSTINTIRPNADKEVHKIIDCFNHNLGASVYVCPKCDEVYFCHHTCKGRLCSSCGIKAQNIMTEHILQTCLNCPHRHITFTIPLDLTMWFFDDLFSNNILFEVNGKI